MSPHCRFSDLGPFRLRIFFRTSGESNPRLWRWIKSTRNQHVKYNERRTRPCHRAYYIRGATPFHSCMTVRSPKLVSSEDRTGARAPSASYCSTEGVAPLHTAPPVPVEILALKPPNCNFKMANKSVNLQKRSKKENSNKWIYYFQKKCLCKTKLCTRHQKTFFSNFFSFLGFILQPLL